MRRWLEVTTDEVQSRRGVEQRLAQRREQIKVRAEQIAAEIVVPAFEKAAETGDWRYEEASETEWAVVCCGIHGPQDAPRDPTAAFIVAEFDAYQPMVILRRKAAGAGAAPHSQSVALDDLDRATVEAFIADA